MSPDRNEEIRDRLCRRLKRLGRTKDYAWLAEQTGTSRGQVWKWATGDTETFPAAFAAVLEEAGVVAARWLLTGEGPEAPTQDPETSALKLEVIGLIVDEEVDPLALKLFAEDAAGQGMGAAAAQARTAALERGAEPTDPEHEETDGPDGPDGSTDRSTDDGNGPPDTTRHAAP